MIYRGYVKIRNDEINELAILPVHEMPSRVRALEIKFNKQLEFSKDEFNEDDKAFVDSKMNR